MNLRGRLWFVLAMPGDAAVSLSSYGAGVTERADWRDECIGAHAHVPNDRRLRHAIASGFADDARMQHASIAAFGRLSLELLAFGAPADLVRDAQRAALDEVDHARTTFALASRFAGTPLGPGRLDVRGIVPATTLAGAVTSAVRDGCVGETIAAMLAEEQAAAAVDRECRDVLRRVAADEARHAELSWRFVAWALGEQPTLAPRVADAFRLAIAGVVPAMTTCEDARARRYGRLSSRDVTRLVADAVDTVLRPCAKVLLDRGGAAAA